MGWWSAQRVECGICQAKCWGPGCILAGTALSNPDSSDPIVGATRVPTFPGLSSRDPRGSADRSMAGSGLEMGSTSTTVASSTSSTLMTEHRGQTAGYANFCPIFEIKWDWSRIHLARLLRYLGGATRTKCLACGRFWTYQGSERSVHEEGTRQVQRIASYPKVTVCTGGRVSALMSGRGCSMMWLRQLVSGRRSTARSAVVGGGVRRMRRAGCWLIWR